MPSTPPPFVPKPSRTGQYVLFLLAPGAGYGARLASLHHDDLDDLLVAIPPGPDAMWQIFDLDARRIVASSDPATDRGRPPVPMEGDGRLLRFALSDEGWGAQVAVERIDAPRPGPAQYLELTTSTIFEDGAPVALVPSLKQIEQYEIDLAIWQTEARGAGEDTEPAPVTEGQDPGAHGMGGAVLPEGWQNLPTAELRALVEAAEQKTGRTPASNGT